MASEPVRLDWIPKRFGPGDLDGDGWLKLLGKPDVDLSGLLVRETAQNSWDARIRGQVPLYEMHLRTLPRGVTEVLGRRVLPSTRVGVGLGGAFDDRPLRVLEISDRRTKGLRGPVRNDRAIPKGTPTDFIDFVLGVGAPPDDPRGGGSYGFGKVVTYMASARGTIVVWSRILTPTGFEHRLIGSGIGKSYDVDGTRYTGRHWWGVKTPPEAGGPVQPLLGQPAAELAGQIFSRGFEKNETGTSLLIVDPVLGEAESDQELVESWRCAIMHNLWPKLMGGASEERRMEIVLRHEGGSVDLRPISDPRLAAFESCLSAVQTTQDGSGQIPAGVVVKEVRSQRPQKLVGHLALTRYPLPVGVPSDLTHHVCLMRNEAELVVKYVKHAQMPDPSLGWAGVFKPTEELDPLYLRSEPPAHDDWVPGSLPTRTEGTLIRTCFTKGDEIVKDFLAPKAVQVDIDGQVSGGDLSVSLADLAGTAVGSKPMARPKQPSRGKGTKKSSVSIVGSELVPTTSESHRQTVRVALRVDGTERIEVRPSRLAWAVEGGREKDKEGLLGEPPKILRWIVNPGTVAEEISYTDSVTVTGGDSLMAEISGMRDRALDVDFSGVKS